MKTKLCLLLTKAVLLAATVWSSAAHAVDFPSYPAICVVTQLTPGNNIMAGESRIFRVNCDNPNWIAAGLKEKEWRWQGDDLSIVDDFPLGGAWITNTVVPSINVSVKVQVRDLTVTFPTAGTYRFRALGTNTDGGFEGGWSPWSNVITVTGATATPSCSMSSN